MKWIVFYYYSLPDFPKECAFFSHEVMHRDFFRCNPSNNSHYENPIFEKMAYTGCHKTQLKSFLSLLDDEKFVVLYTRHIETNGSRSNKIVGYFKVGKVMKDNMGFFASDWVILPKDKAMPVNYNGRGVPVSWGDSSVKQSVSEVLEELKQRKNEDYSHRYQHECRDILKLLKYKDGRQLLNSTCDECKSRENCTWWGAMPSDKRMKRIENIYGKTHTC